ncbi:hypothetical protein SLOPH_1196, partial [Spraguea lophii 42_110]
NTTNKHINSNYKILNKKVKVIELQSEDKKNNGCSIFLKVSKNNDKNINDRIKDISINHNKNNDNKSNKNIDGKSNITNIDSYLKNYLRLKFYLQLSEDIFYNQLRTNECYGYIVGCNNIMIDGNIFISFKVVGDRDVNDICNRIIKYIEELKYLFYYNDDKCDKDDSGSKCDRSEGDDKNDNTNNHTNITITTNLTTTNHTNKHINMKLFEDIKLSLINNYTEPLRNISEFNEFYWGLDSNNIFDVYYRERMVEILYNMNIYDILNIEEYIEEIAIVKVYKDMNI